jgi:hypothetical protein
LDKIDEGSWKGREFASCHGMKPMHVSFMYTPSHTLTHTPSAAQILRPPTKTTSLFNFHTIIIYN